MTRDELEFSISQYLDGTLADAERDALEVRLAGDVEARALLAEYRAIDAGLKAMPLPAVNWDAFASHVSSAVTDADASAHTYRIGGGYRMTRWLAAAAAVVVAGGVALQMLKPVDRTQPVPPAAEAVVIRIVDEPATADGAIAVADATPLTVEIGPSDRLSKTPTLRRYAGDIVSRPSQVIIASSVRPAQDSGGSPF